MTPGGYFRLTLTIYNNDKIELINSPINLGGAGGFSEGIRIANDSGYDWIWIMDDDTIPDRTALEQLVFAASYLSAHEEKVSFLASYVYRNLLLNAKEFHGKIGALLRWGKYFWVSLSLFVRPHVKFRVLKFLAIQKGIWMYIFKPIKVKD